MFNFDVGVRFRNDTAVRYEDGGCAVANDRWLFVICRIHELLMECVVIRILPASNTSGLRKRAKPTFFATAFGKTDLWLANI